MAVLEHSVTRDIALDTNSCTLAAAEGGALLQWQESLSQHRGTTTTNNAPTSREFK